MALKKEEFSEASYHWDLKSLYPDLAFVKGKPLTPMEKLHLRGLLCGFSPSEIAIRLGKNLKGLEADLCTTIYRYIKGLLDKCDERIENWRNITQWLEEAGYKLKISNQISENQLFPDQSVVNITNISIEHNQILIVINLRIPKSQASDIIQNPPTDENES